MTAHLQALTPAQHHFIGELYATRGQKVLRETHDQEAAHTEAASLCAWFVRAWADGTLDRHVIRTPLTLPVPPAPRPDSQGEQMRLEAA
jgi:hypothetical protein